MKEIRILITGAGRRVELVRAFRQAALRLGKKIRLYGADMSGTAPALAFCDCARRVCAMKEPGYIPQLLSICEKDKIDLLIPTIDTDLLILSENVEKFDAIGCKVLVSRPEMIKICRDKNNTSDFFVKCGLKAPMPTNDWRKYSGGYPAFIKPKDGSSSINAFKVENEKELQTYAAQIPDYIVQPFVKGREYTVDVFCDYDGKPMSIVPRERVAVRTGEVLKTKISMDPTIIGEMKQLIAVFKPCGPLTVQLIRDEVSGEDYYIEINPRFGGGSPLSMKAGARSADAILKLASGEIPQPSDGIEDGAVYSRFDDSVCIYREGMPKKISGVIFDLDDTLYPERAYVRSGFSAVAEYLGKPEYAEMLRGYFEAKLPAIDELFRSTGEKSDRRAGCLEAYRTHKPDVKLYEGVAELLTALRKAGIKVGIITDGRPDGQKNKIEALGLRELVDDIIITDELGGEQFRKPCDIAFRIMQTRWRLPFEELVYVGDNGGKDFMAPHRLGMGSLHFANPDGIYYSAESSADAEAGSVEEVRAILGI